jgi:hypothetical protein
MRYFNGRYLNARDFRDEQRYHVSRRALHNRLLHGWGVVCGLQVVHHRPECADRFVIVKPGIAIDCCGREVFVRHKQVLELPKAEDWRENAHRHLFLCLRYCEELIECVPVLDPEGSCEGARKENSRIRESYKLEWHWLSDDDQQHCGWSGSQRHADSERDRDGDGDDDDDAYDTDAAGSGQQDDDSCDERDGGRGCLEPRCPPNDCVLLARLYRDDGKLWIDMSGRPQVPPPADYLTHICRINWPHGGTVTLSELRRRLRRLRVTFDRPLRPPRPGERRDTGPIGVNACTFLVQFGGRGGALEHVEYAPGRPPRLSADRRSAIFTISPDPRRERRGYHYLVGHTVFVTLFCDLIHDCRDLSVDGNHLGKLPSGDGIAGGTFYSWFDVVDDHHDRDDHRDRDEHDHDYDHDHDHDRDQYRTTEERA